MSVDSNRYGRYRTTKLRKTPSGKPVPGDLEDANRFFKCKHCGFNNDIERNTLSDGDGITQSDVPDISYGSAMTGDSLSTYIHVDDMFTLLQLDAEGNPETDYRHNNYPVIVGGCGLCGSLNWL
jgi:hypothetical protein